MDFRRAFATGEMIFAEGDVGDCAYIVESGRVEILVAKDDSQFLLAERRPGEMFGEMAIIDDKPRSASARAAEDCQLLIITSEQLAQRIGLADPILRLCINVILDHLRSTTRRLTRTIDVKATVQQVNDDARQEALAAIRLEQEIQNALEGEQLELWYQPLIDLREGGIAGFEALIRWRHPKRGLVPPAGFVPVAERSGLIVPMTRWAFRRACADLPRLGPDRFMSVNFTSKDFLAPGFLDQIDLTLEDADLPADRIKVEITESLLMQSPETARLLLGQLRERGMSVAIDDFGTGYSSLSYLNTLPADSLKIDQSFVRGMFDDDSNRSLVHSIVGMARGLGLKIVAEGIEEIGQAEALRDLGVDVGQGFLFSRPRPIARIEELVRDWQRPDFL